MTIRVSIAAANATAETTEETDDINTIAIAAPALAPEDTPTISGDASGFLNTS